MGFTPSKTAITTPVVTSSVPPGQGTTVGTPPVNNTVPIVVSPKMYGLTHIETTTELCSSVPVYPGYQFCTVYSIRLPDISPGDILQLSAQCEVTNDSGLNIMEGHYIQLRSTQSPSMRVTAACGTNIDPTRHHSVITASRNYIVPMALSDVYLELVIYSQGFDNQTTGSLTVMAGYGHLDCILIR